MQLIVRIEQPSLRTQRTFPHSLALLLVTLAAAAPAPIVVVVIVQ